MVPDALIAQLRPFITGTVARLAGSNRYATAAALAQARFPAAVGTVYVTTGERFADAVAAVSAAAGESAPVLLVQRNAIPVETAAALRRLAPDRIVIVGGLEAVSDQVKRQLTGLTTR